MSMLNQGSLPTTQSPLPPSLLIKTRISWFLLWQSPRHKGCAASPAGREWFSGSTSSQPGRSPHSSGEPLPSPPPVSGRLPGHSAADKVHCRVGLGGSCPKQQMRPLCGRGGRSARPSPGWQKWLEPSGTGCHWTPSRETQSPFCPSGRRKGRSFSFVPGASSSSCLPGYGSEAGHSPESRWSCSWVPPGPPGRKSAGPLGTLQMRLAWLSWMTLWTLLSRLCETFLCAGVFIGNIGLFNFWMFPFLSTSAFAFLYALSVCILISISQTYFFHYRPLSTETFRYFSTWSP